MTALRFRFLGGYEISAGDQPLAAIPGETARSLFAYLVTYHQRAHRRDLLAGIFWPDLPENVSRRRLSQALWQIRRIFEPHDILSSDGDMLQFTPGQPFWFDVGAFLESAQACEEGGEAVVEQCADCVELYRGDFLPGYYDDWILVERDRLRESYLSVLRTLIAAFKLHGDHERALGYARQLVRQEPWDEQMHQEVMRLCHLLGRDADALRQYQVCQDALMQELGIEPTPETIALADEIARRAGLAEPPVLPAAAKAAPINLLDRPDSLPLVGRETELAEILRQLESAARGRGGMLLVYGEAGIGKTRLLQELAHNADWRGVSVLWGHCYELSDPPAFQPLVEALRAVLPALTEGGLKPLWRVALSRLLPELAAPGEAPVSLSPDEERRRLMEAIAQAFACLDKTPGLVLLEDAHWMDPASLEALRYLCPRLADLPLFFVITVRSEELSDRQAQSLAALESTRLPQRLELKRLDREATGELVQRALDIARPAPVFSARLYTETEGNPFFLIETLWELVDRGLLYRDHSGVWSTPWDDTTQDYAELPLSMGVKQSIQRRLERLPDLLNQLLSLAAVIGREIRFDLWQAASGYQEDQVLLAGDQLCARGLLLSPTNGAFPGVDYTFAHNQVRRVAYQGLVAPRRRTYHRKVAEKLAQLTPQDVGALAYHWTQAGIWDQAIASHKQAGDRAFSLYAYDQAVGHYSQALQALDRLPGSTDLAMAYTLRKKREAAYDQIGERGAQLEDLGALQELAEKQSDPQVLVEVALRQAHYAEVVGDYAAMVTIAQQAVEWAQANHAAGQELAAYLQWGRALWRQNETLAAGETLGQALALARQVGDRKGEADSMHNLGIVAYYQGDYHQARADFEAALELREEIDDLRGVGMTYNNLGGVAADQGDYEAALLYCEQALRIRDQTGDRWGVASTMGNLGGILSEQGRYDEARIYHLQALDICREIGDRQVEANELANLAHDALHQGDHSSARSYIDAALDIFQEIEDRRGECWATVYLAWLAHRSADDLRAIDDSQAALSLAQELGDLHIQAFALTFLGHAWLALGRLDQARDAYQQALDLRRELAETNLAMEALAGLANVALARGRVDQALAPVEEILAYLDSGTLAGATEPFKVHLACYQVLSAAGDPRAGGVLERAYQLLLAQLERLSDPGLKQGYLDGIAANRAILAAYRGVGDKQSGDRLAVHLPRAGAPTGRPLREDEYIQVFWTVASPEDGKITSKVARRQARLLRMLDEAAAQDAAPTVEDLAAALQVSAPTVKRDLAHLRNAGHSLHTRGAPRS